VTIGDSADGETYRTPPQLADIVRRGMPSPIGVGIRHRGDGTPALHVLEEQSLGPRAVERRRVYFSMGRAAARDALAELGIYGVAIERGASGEPLWPTGIVGAISHAGDLAIAIVGRQDHYAGLGIDVEQLSRGLTARAARLICTTAEMDWVNPDADTTRLTMLFSAKEAVFKALFPIEGVWLGFGDAELTWHQERCAFDARLLKYASAAHPVGALLEVRCSVVGADVLSTTYALP
jgi:4'-phosphopantetheinyl transferase EntD